MITAIWGPPGSGKTSNADYLKGKYAAKRIVDEWPNGEQAQDGDLILTQYPNSAPKGSRIIHIAEALRK